MRESKYRGKRVDTQEWVEGYYVVEDGKHAIMTQEHDGNSRLLWNEVDPETVSQWIWLQDKNGVDIFDDELIKYWNDEHTEFALQRVVWDKSKMGYVLSQEGLGLMDSGLWMRDWFTTRAEALGSFYDNPALLEKEVT